MRVVLVDLATVPLMKFEHVVSKDAVETPGKVWCEHLSVSTVCM